MRVAILAPGEDGAIAARGCRLERSSEHPLAAAIVARRRRERHCASAANKGRGDFRAGKGACANGDESRRILAAGGNRGAEARARIAF